MSGRDKRGYMSGGDSGMSGSDSGTSGSHLSEKRSVERLQAFVR